MCVFYDKTHDIQDKAIAMQSSCIRAVNCALLLVDTFTDMLTSHVGLSCGELEYAAIGGFKGEWTHILSGAIIPQLSSCVDEAGSKQLAVTEDVMQNLRVVLSDVIYLKTMM